MSDQTILYLLAFLGYAGVIMTQLRRRTTTVKVWMSENKWGVLTGLVSAATVLLIGPGDDVDLGSYMARTWAASIASGIAYLVGGNIPSGQASDRRLHTRAESKQ